MGGYAQLIQSGVNGFLFNRDEQALELIERLRHSPDLCRSIGVRARQSILELCGRTGFERFSRFYLQ